MSLLFFIVLRVLQQTHDLVRFRLKEQKKKISLQTKSSTLGDTSYKDDKPWRMAWNHRALMEKDVALKPARRIKAAEDNR